eukprot:TRINITY_DN28519_c0_g1_i1.p1 TRINITY_DN28519_c0_g1~~TRINITY_DN28519_c0_g1_i1.p1  ORF type:complete len:304 (+),score=52.75 TRINITY_DN28519_c0_g1_i1:106-1017(+)
MPPKQATAGKCTGNLVPLAQRRVLKERQKLEQEKDDLVSCGIHILWGDDLHKASALIVGPQGTPYENGFYFFDVVVSDNYPIAPPRVDFKTGDGRVRFNPNLYVEGKVCLSILGTWSGPSWTSSCTLRTVLVSIQSLLNEHPIQNEPGHESEVGQNDRLYSEIIAYENIAVAVVRMLRKTPEQFASFRPHMRQVFLKNYDAYVEKLENYARLEGSSTRSPIWSFPVKYQPKAILKELEELRILLQAEESSSSSGATPLPNDSAVQSNDVAASADAAASAPAETPAPTPGQSPKPEPSTKKLKL